MPSHHYARGRRHQDPHPGYLPPRCLLGLLRSCWSAVTRLAAVLVVALPPCTPAAPYIAWQKQADAIHEPLAGLVGNAVRGRELVQDPAKGNCLSCHGIPLGEGAFHGGIGPPLVHVASRLSAAQLRLRVVDQKQINPATIMPGYYRNPEHFNRVLDEYLGETVLTAQEIEDIIAFLRTLE